MYLVKVRKWFDNTRWSFNHRPSTGADGTPSHQNTASSAITTQSHIVKPGEEMLVTGDSSENPATKKRKGNLNQAPGDEQNGLGNIQSAQLHTTNAVS